MIPYVDTRSNYLNGHRRNRMNTDHVTPQKQAELVAKIILHRMEQGISFNLDDYASPDVQAELVKILNDEQWRWCNDG